MTVKCQDHFGYKEADTHCELCLHDLCEECLQEFYGLDLCKRCFKSAVCQVCNKLRSPVYDDNSIDAEIIGFKCDCEAS